MWSRPVFGRVLTDSEVYDATSRPSRLLKRVSIQPSRGRDFAEAISGALKENFALARSPHEASQFVSVPARDIIIVGNILPDGFASSIAESLTRMHGQFRPDFRVETLEASSELDAPQVYFGRGVFASSDATQVADIEFCATPGDAKPEKGAKTVQPMLRSQSGGNRPAAWYVGQLGLAIGFRPDSAPATILPEEFGGNWEPILQDLVLFLGRQRESDPVIRLFRRERTIDEKENTPQLPTVDRQFVDWHERDGIWQWLEINGRKLWFRITNRTGASLFSTDTDLIRQRGRTGGGAAGLVIVRGLILPPLPRRRDNYSGWRVEFQSDETLRHSELGGLAWTAAAQRRRYGIFSHTEGEWRGEEKSATGDMLLPLGKNRRLELRYLDQTALKSNVSFQSERNDVETVDQVYGRNSLVLGYVESARSQSVSMGAFLLAGDNEEDGWQRLVSEPIRPRRGGSITTDDEPLAVSLDWVNRAAWVDGDISLGLAQFWLNRWRLEAKPTAHHLEIRIQIENEVVRPYRIRNGSRGALGPLWVEYVWLDE